LRVKHFRAHHAQTLLLAVSTVEPLSAVPSNPLITRMSVKGCEAWSPDLGEEPDRALALRGVDLRERVLSSKETGESIGSRSAPGHDRRPAGGHRPSIRYLDLLANKPFENRRPRDLTVTADDLLAVTPVMLEACVLRSTFD
jgi:hypothetical protein